ncbi:sigma 54-interacting transcriptional regulator [Dehalobacter sp. DCM]|uniref:sigma-54 interaction domain-containing protein n=1 Tax=Dehalobacter sp. DCM TaxID=2907827 RepID=UPI003081EB65|nr:sigma 54-interacting transcriptional regulator [Dehalobacter sp. DCM]
MDEASIINVIAEEAQSQNMESISEKYQEMSKTHLRLSNPWRITEFDDGRDKKGSYDFEDIIGESSSMRQTISIAKKIARSHVTILLNGESGTGKELLAQAIHQSYCPKGPFIAINCASIPRNLIESELFGYEGGAFTGAEKKGRQGKFELADGGTIFLDEIGDMPLEIQPVLLRVLEENGIVRIGGIKKIPIDVRVIAATHNNLYQKVKENKFREDLYYRLSVFKIELPPLRDRYNDSLLLARYFIQKICEKECLDVPELSDNVCKIILKYNWPGNVRQLENAMIYAVYIAQNGHIRVSDLPNEILSEVNIKSNNGTLCEIEKQAIEETLCRNEFRVLEAAKTLGINPSTLYRKIKKYGIRM